MQINKHRWSEEYTISLRIDFQNGSCELVENPKAAQETAELKRIYQIIIANPGIWQNKLAELCNGIKRERLTELLENNDGVLWNMTKQGNKKLYYPHGMAIPE